MCLRRLYARVDLEIPKESSSPWDKGNLGYVRPHVLRVLRELSIRNGTVDNRDPSHNRKHRLEESRTDAFDLSIVDQVPMNQLRAFS